MADPSPGSEVQTPLNRLPVTRSCNWSTWADGDLPHYWPDIKKKKENIWYEKPLAPWVMMNLRMMEMKEVNEPEPMEEWTNWTMQMKSIWFWWEKSMTSPHFLPIMDGKMGRYPPKMGNIPTQKKRGKNQGMRNLFSKFIYIFWTFFVICPSPRNGGIAEDSKVMHDFWNKFAFVYFDFVNEAVIMEQRGRYVSHLQALGTHPCTSTPEMFLTPLAFQACFPWGELKIEP